MTDDPFDPYHKWLGIPPRLQPAHHYRLLGVAEFETDADVIDAAANQRMSFLHEMAGGPLVEHSQRLLNEIAAARLTLLDPEKKSAYDRQLRAAARPRAGTSAARSSLWLWIGAGAFLAITITIIAVIAHRLGQKSAKETSGNQLTGKLILVWPLNRRDGAVLRIDGKPRKIPKEAEFTLDLPVGFHSLQAECSGCRTLEEANLMIDNRRPIKRTLNFVEVKR